MARLTDLGLFPLGIVLLPGETVPLHIFEPRYRELVARCTAGPEPFCIAYADGDGMRATGCLAIDVDVLARYPDGRLDVAVTGGEPVLLEHVDDDAHSYLTADALVLEDDDDDAADDDVGEALTVYRELVARASSGPEEAPPEPAPGPRLSYRIAGQVELAPVLKQALLEARSERARLVDLTAILRRALNALDAAAIAAERASRNGHVRSPDDLLGDQR